MSIAAAISGGSRIQGSGIGSDVSVVLAVRGVGALDDEGAYSEGRIEGKYRWKKMVCKMPFARSRTRCWSEKISRVYECGGEDAISNAES